MSKKGKIEFSKVEYGEIRDLLIEKVRSQRKMKKNIRNKIRKFGFYISDFRKTKREFIAEDFIELIKEKIIKIIT